MFQFYMNDTLAQLPQQWVSMPSSEFGLWISIAVLLPMLFLLTVILTENYTFRQTILDVDRNGKEWYMKKLAKFKRQQEYKKERDYG